MEIMTILQRCFHQWSVTPFVCGRLMQPQLLIAVAAAPVAALRMVR